MCFLIGKAGGPSEVLLRDPPPRLLPIFLSKREGPGCWPGAAPRSHLSVLDAASWALRCHRAAAEAATAHSALGSLLTGSGPGDSGTELRAGRALLTSHPPSPCSFPQHRVCQGRPSTQGDTDRGGNCLEGRAAEEVAVMGRSP